MESYYEPIEVEHLIAEVKARPVIWNSSLEEYNDRTKKYQAWQEVIKACTAGWETLSPFIRQEKAKEIQKRWKNVRDHYVRELKMMSGGVVRKKRKYIYFDRLSFLGTLHQNKISSTTPRFKSALVCSEDNRSCQETAPEDDSNGDSSVPCDPFGDLAGSEKSDSGDPEDGGQDEAEERETRPASTSETTVGVSEEVTLEKVKVERSRRGRKPGSGKMDFRTSLLEILKTGVASREEQSGDEDRLFMLSLVPELKRVPPSRRLLVKTQIIQAIFHGQQFRDSGIPR
ncbi:uncharacterized protein LOC124167827 [Ischnura elegans]|uniref:uncharacterized protein LOC124167827 n=1 Tax=Ischnura elegans TaxID=197161 RepID=UPI001ED8673B|nr:uncharacterized protein LOC124167827 [Ischnura elegans]